MKKWIIVLAAVSLLSASLGAVAGPPFNVDDPGTAEHKRVELELTYESSQLAGSEAQAFPGLSLAYGLYDNVELSLDLRGVSVRNAGVGRFAGFGDIKPAVKWRFLEETKTRPQLAFGYSINIPTADVNRGLGTGATDHSVWFSGAKYCGRTMLFGNAGYNFLGGSEGTNNLFLGLGVTYQLSEQLIVGAQLYGNTHAAPGARDELAWGGGLTYNFAPNRAFLLQLGRSEHGFSDLNVFAGITFTLGK